MMNFRKKSDLKLQRWIKSVSNYKLLQMLFYITRIFSIYRFLIPLFYDLKL
jgi:hypothetical protein